MESAVMNAGDAIWISKADAGYPFDYKLVFANTAFEKATGYRFEDLVGKSPRILHGPKTDPQETERVRRSILENRNCRSELLNYRKDGSEFWVELVVVPLLDEDGRRTHVLSIRRDITERKHAEIELARLAAIVQSSADGIISTTLDGIILTWNEAAQKLFGYSPSEVVGHSVRMLVPPALRLELRGMIKEIQKGESILYCETVRLKKDGTQMPIGLTVSPVRDSSGNLAGVSGIYHDITERKRHEKALRDSRQQLRNLAARIEAIREDERAHIAREVHDELGQTLMILKLEISKLLERHRDSRLTTTLIDQAIDSVHKICSELRPSLLDDLGLGAAIEWQAQDFEGRTGIACRLDLEDVKLGRDESTAIFRILQELLVNVARHSGATKVVVLLKQSRKHVQLKVADNGRGLSKRHITDPKSLGILGMQERATLLGGTIEFHGVRGKGTTVSLTMPNSPTD